MRHSRFQHPRVITSIGHRPLTKLDWSIPKTPLHDVLADLVQWPDGSGWSAIVAIDGTLHRVRGGGARGGPRSFTLGPEQAGVYVMPLDDDADYAVSEIVALAGAPSPCPLDCLELQLVGVPIESVPCWDGWVMDAVASEPEEWVDEER